MVVGGGDDVVGVVVGGAVTGVGGWVAGVDACVGVVTLELDDEPCVVDVTGWVVEAPGAVVDVAPAAPAVALAGMPLRNTANHTLPTFCPFAWPFFLSPSKV